MNVCKKCGEIAKLNNYITGYYCYKCGNLGFNEVYSMVDIYKEWLEYRCLCASPDEIKVMLWEHRSRIGVKDDGQTLPLSTKSNKKEM